MGEERNILVLGAGHEQLPIIKRIKERGYKVNVVDANPQAPGFQYADDSKVISTRDSTKLIQYAKKQNIVALTSMITESGLISMAKIARHLGLPGPHLKSAFASISKIYMRCLFQKVGLPCAKFAKTSHFEEAVAWSKHIGYPIVIKPSDRGGQRGLNKIFTHNELYKCFWEAKQLSFSNEVIIEECLEGNEVNVVAIVINKKIYKLIISDRVRHLKKAFGVVLKHIYPSVYASGYENYIYEICQKAVEAMNIDNGIIFPQLIITKKGPIFVEIGERIPGGIMKEVFEYTTGIDLIDFQLDVALGNQIKINKLKKTKTFNSLVVKFLTAEPGDLTVGKVVRYSGLDDAVSIPNVISCDFFDPGNCSEIRSLKSGNDRFFYIIAGGDNKEEVLNAVELASEKINFEVVN